MEPAERQMKQFDIEQPSILPAIVSCVAGILGMVMVAAGPWLLVSHALL